MRALAAALLLTAGLLAAPNALAASDSDPCMEDPATYGTGACLTCSTDLLADYYDCIVQACVAGIYYDYAAYQHPDRLSDYAYYGGYKHGDRTCGGPLAEPYQQAMDAYLDATDDPYAATEPVRDLACPISVGVLGGGAGADC